MTEPRLGACRPAPSTVPACRLSWAAAALLLLAGVLPAQMPNECCQPAWVGDLFALSIVVDDEDDGDQSTPGTPFTPFQVPQARFAMDPLVDLMPQQSSTTSAGSVALRDVGTGATTVSTYGSVERRLPMPVMHDGMMGLSKLYHGFLIFDFSYPAWEGSGTDLKPSVPVPNMSAANLLHDEGVQPRPGNMPGLYILQVDHSEGTVYYQYGGPLETGANPQTTAIYGNPPLSQTQGGSSSGSSTGGVPSGTPAPESTELPPPPTMAYQFTSNLTGAQLWYDATASRIEIRHVDGSVASYESFNPYIGSYSPSPAQTLWRIDYVRDPYDNTADYVYNTKDQLTEIQFPSGLTQVFDWSPSWAWGGTNDCLEISYTQNGSSPTEAAARTWGIVFKGATSVTGGRYFGKRLHRVYSASRKVLADSTGQGAWTIDANAEVTGQIVHEFDYDTSSNRVVTEYHKVHTGAAFAETLVKPSNNDDLAILETYFTASGYFDKQTRTQTAETITASYPSPTRSTEVLSGAMMDSIQIVKTGGTTHRYDYDYDSGRLYSEFITPSNDASGRPRATEFPSGPPAGAGVEPEVMEKYYVYDSTCVCRKPIRFDLKSTEGGQTETRSWEFEYWANSKLIKKRREPNPKHGPGGPHAAFVEWSYTYQQSKGAGHVWGAWLPLTEDTPDGTFTYTHSDMLNRADATQHGQIPGKTVKTIADVKIQDTLVGAANTTVSGSDVSETVWRNLSNSPGGLAQQGNINGQPRKVEDGDGVTTVLSYNTQGRLTQTLTRSSEQTDFVRNAIGDVTQVTHYALSSHPAVVTYDLAASFPAPRKVATSSAGAYRDTRSYYDRFGHRAAVQMNNLASNGAKPTKHVPDPTAARDWVEKQYHYQHTQLMEVYIDRKPLDEPVGGVHYLVTKFDYATDGRLASVDHPNGSVSFHTYDGFGTLYKTVTENPGGTADVSSPAQFINEFLEVNATHQSTGSDDLWTLIERNAAGAITKITEPSTTAPAGYTHSTGGAQHSFQVDELGRITQVESSDGSQVLAKRSMRFDQLSRRIWQHDTVLRRNTSGTTPISAGDRHVAWQFVPGKATQLTRILRTGVDETGYTYLSDGRLEVVAQSGDSVEYEYHTGTSYLSRVERHDVDAGLGGQRITATEYDVDALGRVTAIRQGATATTPLLHQYAYNSFGQVDRYTDPAGLLQKFLPDALGRVVEHVHDGASSDIRNRTVFTDSGDAAGKTLVARYDDLENVTVTHYDFAGRPFILQNPGASTVPSTGSPHQVLSLLAVYDDASRITDIYDGDLGRTRFVRDGAGRVIKRWLENQTVGGQQSIDKISGWNATDWIRRDALGRIEHHDYLADPINQVPIGTGQTWQDSIGRVHNERYYFAQAPLNTIEVQSSYTSGNPYRDTLEYEDGLPGASAFKQKLHLSYTHDGRGRLDTISWDTAANPTTPSYSGLADYGWAGSLRRTRELTPAGVDSPVFDTLMTWDEFGRLTKIKDEFTDTNQTTPLVCSQFDYEYDLASNLVKEVYDKVDGSVGDRFAYDEFHRLSEAWMGVSSMSGSPPSGFVSGQVKQHLTYDLDGVHNRTATTRQKSVSGALQQNYVLQDGTHPQGPSNRYESISAPALGGVGAAVPYEYDDRGNLICDGKFVYKYDYMNRLSEVWEIQPDAPPGGEEEKYAEAQQGGFRGAQEDVKLEVPNLYERLLDEHMDPVFRNRLRATITGGVITMTPTVGGGGMPSFVPANGQLVLKGVFVYDAFNRRTISIWVGVATWFHVYDGWREVAEHTLDDGAPYYAVPQKQFAWGAGLDELVGYRRKAAGGVWEDYHLLHGGQDTSAKLVDEAGDSVEEYEYSPYGEASVYQAGSTLALAQSTVGLPFLWKGLRCDVVTALVHMRHRFFSPMLGRFTSVDRIGVWGDIGNVGGGYAYCASSPLDRGDPTGLQSTGEPPYIDPSSLNLSETHHAITWSESEGGHGGAWVPVEGTPWLEFRNFGDPPHSHGGMRPRYDVFTGQWSWVDEWALRQNSDIIRAAEAAESTGALRDAACLATLLTPIPGDDVLALAVLMRLRALAAPPVFVATCEAASWVRAAYLGAVGAAQVGSGWLLTHPQETIDFGLGFAGGYLDTDYPASKAGQLGGMLGTIVNFVDG